MLPTDESSEGTGVCPFHPALGGQWLGNWDSGHSRSVSSAGMWGEVSAERFLPAAGLPLPSPAESWQWSRHWGSGGDLRSGGQHPVG